MSICGIFAPKNRLKRNERENDFGRTELLSRIHTKSKKKHKLTDYKSQPQKKNDIKKLKAGTERTKIKIK